MAEIDADQRLNVWSTSQIPYMARGAICLALGLPPSRVRVMAPRLGGGFGSKENVYPEEIIVPAVAMMLGRKVRWLEDRREHFTASVHAREETVQVEASVDVDGNITAIKLDCITDIGAAFTVVGNTVTTLMGAMIRGPYRVPGLDARMRSVVTNKVPLNVFRGAGHPQAVLIMERLLDLAAERLGLDRAEIRRRNLLSPEELPLDRSATDCIGARRIVYDEGRYETCFAMALEQAGYAGIAAEKKAARARGKALGIGFSNHVEMTAIGPHEEARVMLGPQGRIIVFSPIVPMGQGSEITQRQIVADELGIPIEQIDIRFGNTDDLTDAVGAFASRGAAIGGAVIRLAARGLKDAIIDRYAQVTNASRQDLEWTRDGLTGPFLANSPATLPEISARLGVRDAGSSVEATFRLNDIKPSYSYAAHVAIVEIDLETLKISIPRYAVAHDCGTVINPLLVEGQIVGGVIQGLGGLLREHLRYDDVGRLLTSRLMDYVLPGVSDVPSDFRLGHIETPSSFAPFNVRGVGEGGVTGCYGAIATAMADALAEHGVTIAGSGPYSPSFLFGLLADPEKPGPMGPK
jgi:carbon-monoxide dehydrogenase large subunit